MCEVIKIKTHEEYINDVKKRNPYIKINSIYKGSLNQIEAECLLCGHKWNTIASYINNKRSCSCPNCHFHTKDNFKNALINTEPEIANWLHNKHDGEIYSAHSNKKVDWDCPFCGELVSDVMINHVTERKHVPCKRCSDGISYPEKYVSSMLRQLDLDFIFQYSPNWIKPKRYDFYIPSKNIIIETDGALGHGNKIFGKYFNNPNELLEIDRYKDKLALEHDIEVIRIDCIESDSDYIKNNILNSKLSTLFDLSNVDFLLCNKDAYSSLKIKVCNIWNEYHEMENVLQETKLPRPTVIRYLKDCSKYGLCNYNPKEQMRRSGQRNISHACFSNNIRVICITTGEIFNSISDAYRWIGYNPNGHTIQDNCKGKQKTAGKHPITKERLTWMFYDDYLYIGGFV